MKNSVSQVKIKKKEKNLDIIFKFEEVMMA